MAAFYGGSTFGIERRGCGNLSVKNINTHPLNFVSVFSTFCRYFCHKEAISHSGVDARHCRDAMRCVSTGKAHPSSTQVVAILTQALLTWVGLGKDLPATAQVRLNGTPSTTKATKVVSLNQKKARTPVTEARAFLSQPVLCETGCRVVGVYIYIYFNTLLDFIIILQNRCFGCGLIKHPYRPFFILLLVGYIHRTTNKRVKHIANIDDGRHTCHSV